MKKGLVIVGVNVVVLVGLLVLIEGIGQAVSLAKPAYDVLFLRPDRVLGWTEVPNLQWTWAGHEWIAQDFTVKVSTNASGFRDIDHAIEKPANSVRVAMLGDSFIEAVQVPFERTAAQQLQSELNAGLGDKHAWEVLNFGISNYGVGQYLLAWRTQAKQYRPDYVVAFVSALHMRRTLAAYETGVFGSGAASKLWVRPVFSLENGELVEHPAKDFETFQRLQNEVIAAEFGGERSRPKKKQLATLYYLRDTWQRIRALRTPRHAAIPPPVEDPQLLPVNFALLKTIAREVSDAGGHFIVVDPSRYLDPAANVAQDLKQLCESNGIGYVPVHEDLLAAIANGQRLAWSHDSHFTDSGNTILAKAIYKSIEARTKAR